MRRIILSFWFVLFAGGLWAQQPADKTEKAAIQRVKNALVSSLDSSLPKVSLEFFLNYESGGAPIQWQLIDCGEPTGKPSTNRGTDSPLCVEADFEKDQMDVAVLISAGTLKNGPLSLPALLRVTVNGPGGKSHSLRRLGELPKELHRPAPRSPRDFPVPVIALSG